ncbi:MAG: OPT/YSL family transporter [Endozoicomonas sp.]
MLVSGFTAYLGVVLILAVGTGIYTGMSTGQMVLWVIFAAVATIVAELIVGIASMYSGWFSSFATALIFLGLGMLIGFPPEALAVLVGFTVATGPSFSDMAYDLKSDWIVRGEGKNQAFELAGWKQQYFAELFSFCVAITIVALVYNYYFDQGQVPPVARVYIAAIEAGASSEAATYLIQWTDVGALIQWVGGESKQLDILFAAGLLIRNPMACVAIFIGLLIRWFVTAKFGDEGKKKLYVISAGFIAGSAIYSFFSSTLKMGK